MVLKEQPVDAPRGGLPLPRAFHTQPRGAQVAAAVGGPAVLGALSGLALGVWAPLYWALQVVAVLGGLAAGLEHHGVRSGALRGLLGGTIFGGVLLLARALSGLRDHASLGSTPGLLVVVTAAIGCVLGALGGALRARRA